MHVGILHPGQMGFTVALSAVNSGHQVSWVSAGRSVASARRAAEAGLTDAGSLEALCSTCEVIVSICPPEFAEATASHVAACGFKGIFLDANAVSPERVRLICAIVTKAGADFVDGGIIGLPAKVRGKTWLCLSGKRAADAAAFFSAGPLEIELLGDAPDRASALKMVFAAWTKGTTAMLCSILGAAEQLGVLEELKRQWAWQGLDWPGNVGRIERAAPKAWRWVDEMREIAATLGSAGMDTGFHESAARVYERLAGFKDSDADLAKILARLRDR